MQVEEFLSLLKGVRASGEGRWVARCPHHNDRSPSLAITRGDDVPILIHCFAGCDVEQIVGALGLELSDLMPDDNEYRPRQALPFTCQQAMRCLATESRFLFIVAADIAAGKPVDALTKDRLIQAAARIHEARRLCNV